MTDFEQQKVSIGTVLTWIGGIAALTMTVASAWSTLDHRVVKVETFKESFEDRHLEQRIDNLERKVVWREQQP
jgi:uncharacterized coiled-coil protein SlyX